MDLTLQCICSVKRMRSRFAVAILERVWALNCNLKFSQPRFWPGCLQLLLPTHQMSSLGLSWHLPCHACGCPLPLAP